MANPDRMRKILTILLFPLQVVILLPFGVLFTILLHAQYRGWIK